MRSIGKVIGMILWVGSGILMFLFMLFAMHKWLGIIGVILALIFSPGIVIFPIVFWVVEGVFPAFYFIVWGAGIVGLIISGLSSTDE